MRVRRCVRHSRPRPERPRPRLAHSPSPKRRSRRPATAPRSASCPPCAADACARKTSQDSINTRRERLGAHKRDIERHVEGLVGRVRREFPTPDAAQSRLHLELDALVRACLSSHRVFSLMPSARRARRLAVSFSPLSLERERDAKNNTRPLTRVRERGRVCEKEEAKKESSTRPRRAVEAPRKRGAARRVRRAASRQRDELGANRVQQLAHKRQLERRLARHHDHHAGLHVS